MGAERAYGLDIDYIGIWNETRMVVIGRGSGRGDGIADVSARLTTLLSAGSDEP